MSLTTPLELAPTVEAASPGLTLMRAFAAASALCVAAMVLLSWQTGLNVQHFERVSSPETWAAELLAHAQALRWLTVIDDAFVACYVAASVLLVRALRERAPSGAVIHALGPWVVSAAALVGVLDLIENHHVLSLLHAVEHGQTLGLEALVQREGVSSVKWMVGHVAFCMLGVALWFDTVAWRALRGALIGLQLPVGAAALAFAGSPLGEALGWLKLFNVSLGFLALATLPWPRAAGSGERE